MEGELIKWQRNKHSEVGSEGFFLTLYISNAYSAQNYKFPMTRFVNKAVPQTAVMWLFYQPILVLKPVSYHPVCLFLELCYYWLPHSFSFSTLIIKTNEQINKEKGGRINRCCNFMYIFDMWKINILHISV